MFPNFTKFLCDCRIDAVNWSNFFTRLNFEMEGLNQDVAAARRDGREAFLFGVIIIVN